MLHINDDFMVVYAKSRDKNLRKMSCFYPGTWAAMFSKVCPPS